MADQVTKVGKYQIVEQVGEGAMGVVYRAIDPVLNRPVAIKIMNEGLAQDEALRQRFLREAQAAGSLQHPNVVTIYDFGETDGHLFIAMEFIEGTDLESLLMRSTGMPLATRLDIIIDVLNGLAYAHRRGIIHRDIKPANIRIDAEGHARIMDFGVAHLATSNLTGTGVMMGTPNYMAPEQITSGLVTPAADIFSVGAVLYELLTNTKPFAADTLHRVLFRIVSDPPPELLQVMPELPLALDKVVKKALAKDVKERYGSATEMANDLSAVRASLGAPRASRTVSQRSSIEKALSVQRQAQHARDVRRWQLISAAAALLFVVGGGGGVYLTVRRQATRDAQVTALPASRPDSARADSTPPATPPAGVVVAGAPRDSTPKSVPANPAPQPDRRGAVETQQRSTSALPPRRTDTRSATGSTPVVSRPSSQSPSEPAATPTETLSGRSDSASRDTAAARAAAAPPPVAPPASAPANVSAALSSSRTDTTPPRVVAPAENPRTAVSSIVNAYARAIATRNVDEVRRVYSGMTPAQQSAWVSFFSSVRSMTATLEVASFEASGDSAFARITGAYEFVTRAGRPERQPAQFEATFVREGERWRLRTVR